MYEKQLGATNNSFDPLLGQIWGNIQNILFRAFKGLIEICSTDKGSRLT